MALPKITTPIYELTLPISKKFIKFRPFLVKEQKILLMALESGESGAIESNIKHVLNNCLITDLDIDTLPIVDVEYFFLHLRARSVGEVIESKYKCENEVDGKKCNNMMETSFNILEVNVESPKQLNDTIVLSDGVGIKLKYPNFDVVERLQEQESATDSAFELILDCIDYIYDDENVYHAYESTKEELMSFLESLTSEQFEKLQEFIDNLPKLKKDIQITCSKCGFKHNIRIEGLDSFF